MNLQDLIDELSSLRPKSSLSAPVVVRNGDALDLIVVSARYEDGEVIIECDEQEVEE